MVPERADVVEKVGVAAANTNGRFGAVSGRSATGWRMPFSCRSAPDPMAASLPTFAVTRNPPFLKYLAMGSIRAGRERAAVSCSTRKPDNRMKQTIRDLKA